MSFKIAFCSILGSLIFTMCASASVVSPSNGGNSLLHSIGWQTFENAGANNDSGISDTKPDSNSTFDANPVGSYASVTGGGQYLTGIIGAGSTSNGRAGFGQSTAGSFLNDANFGSATVGSAPFGMNIVDVPLADGSAGMRIGPNGGTGTSSWKFKTASTDDSQGDFSIKNESDYTFRLERIHFDARRAVANSPTDLDLVYVGSGISNLIQANTGLEVPSLHVITSANFAAAGAETDISVSVGDSLMSPTEVRLAPGDSASFRFRWTNAGGAGALSQIDNLAISGTFQDQDNSFAPINPVPEPSGILLAIAASLSLLRRRRK